jgi:hypothetical protein
VTTVFVGDGLAGSDITSAGTISHADTSTQTNVTATADTYVDGLTFDTYGHVTGVTTSVVQGFDGDYNSLTNKPTIPANAGDLGDVTITAAATGEVLKYNGTAWVDANVDYSELTGTPTLFDGAYSSLTGAPTIPSNVEDLANVTVTTAATGEVLKYNGTAWVDANVDYSELTGTPTLFDGAYSSLTGAPTIPSNVEDLANVTVTAAATGEVLRFDGANWVDAVLNYSDLTGVPSTFAPSAHTLSSHSDVAATAPTDGQVLAWNNTGSTWEPQTVSGGGGVSENTDVTFSGLTVSDNAGTIFLEDTNVVGNEKLWSVTSNNGRFGVDSYNDDGTLRGRAYAVFHDNTDDIRFHEWYTGTGQIKMKLEGSDGSLELRDYGAGNITGTATKMLAVDVAGKIVEEDLPVAFDGAYGSLTGVPTDFTPSAHTLSSHSDVAATVATDGQVLTWNNTGSTWEPQNASVGVSENTNVTFDTLTVTGQINGPADMIIDPAVVGNNTGKVTIKGDLQVDGTTTTINSTTLAVDDLEIVVADGAADSATADQAGIKVDGANATLHYRSTGDKWQTNKPLDVQGNITSNGAIEDVFGDVRKVSVTTSSDASVTIPSSSSGKLFRLVGAANNTVVVDRNNFSEGDVVTIYNVSGAPNTISLSFSNWSNGVRVAGGDGTNYNNTSTLQVEAYGLVTLTAVAGTRLVVSGNAI